MRMEAENSTTMTVAFTTKSIQKVELSEKKKQLCQLNKIVLQMQITRGTTLYLYDDLVESPRITTFAEQPMDEDTFSPTIYAPQNGIEIHIE